MEARIDQPITREEVIQALKTNQQVIYIVKLTINLITCLIIRLLCVPKVGGKW